jgi:flagellar biosynthesis/type III secretory pathway protein FliH
MDKQRLENMILEFFVNNQHLNADNLTDGIALNYMASDIAREIDEEYSVAVNGSSYDQGYDDGRDEGYSDGYDEGNTEGYDEGHDHGYSEGYDAAKEELNEH